MEILLAASNRDLLQCYQKLLTMDGHTVTGAFDGARTIFLLSQRKFDIAIMEQGLPRIELDQLLGTLTEAGTPVILLADENVTVKTLLRPQQPSAYLSLPFLPSDLTGLMRSVMEKARSGELLRCGEVEVDVSGFRFSGADTHLTNGEIDLLRELKTRRRTAGKRTRVMIQALNEKLKALGKHARIIYEMEKGYRLVNDYE